jgi:hypothetical protein
MSAFHKAETVFWGKNEVLMLEIHATRQAKQ